MKREHMTSSAVISALRNGPFREPAHVWLYEVRNTTGYSRRIRSADALVVSVWPSRGIWIAGIEVKVDRSDWRRELNNPAKAAELQQYCDYWWIAAPDGVVEASEVPETWGQLVVTGKKVSKAREAPKIERAEWNPGFVASLLRNGAEVLQRVRQEGHAEGYKEASERHDADAHEETLRKLTEAERELRRVQQQLSWKEREITSMRQAAAEFESAAGISGMLNGGTHGAKSVGSTYRLALALQEMNLATIAVRLRQAADEVAGIEQLKGAAE